MTDTTGRHGVVVLGSANLDLVYRVERIPQPGETLLASSSAQHPGGKGANQAVAAARSGADVVFLGALGTDAAGDRLASVLTESGVAVEARRVEEPTGTALIVVSDDAENTIVVDSGANGTVIELTEPERTALAGAGFLLSQLETPLPAVTAAARLVAEAGGVVVLNASPVQELPATLLSALTVLVVNEHEAAVISEKAVDADPESLLSALLVLVPAVVLTLGSAGSILGVRGPDGDEVRRVPALRVTAVDTTGAGDTFVGALLAALSRRADRRVDLDALVEAAEYSTAAAALAVQREGAVPSIPTRAEVEHLRGGDRGAADGR